MSFLSGILNLGKQAIGFLSGNTLASSLAKTAILGYTLNRLSKNAIKNNQPNLNGGTAAPDAGVRIQIPPATDKKIPVLYGTAHFGGIITEAVMSNNNKTMTYVITLSEKTGTKLSDSIASAYIFKDIYWNDQRIIFNSDGITVNYTVDRSGNIDRSLSSLVKIYCYAGNSTTPQAPENYTNPSIPNAYAVVPNWTSSYSMSNLIFAVIEVNYNREKNVTGIGEIKFHIENSMKLPGDCLYDYMINTRYGAGIPAGEIYSA
jgi:hypothetical protein